MPQFESANELSNIYDNYRRQGRIEFITFHPSYSYEEFIEGITVGTDGEDKPTEKLQYILRPGIFKTFCKKALASAIGLLDEEIEKVSWKEVYDDYLELEGDVIFDEAPKYVLIIDEINRGDIAKIFGELISLLETDKRLGEENQLVVKLPTSGDYFGVPPNVYIVGTMNTADRSIALLDVALRRRFGFVEMNPDFQVLQKEHIEKNKHQFDEGVYNLLLKSKEAVEIINSKLCLEKTIGRDRQIGQSFFFKVSALSHLQMVWRHEILPLLEEYCYGDYQKINRILFNKDSDTEWISEAAGIKEFNNLDKMLTEILKNEQSI